MTSMCGVQLKYRAKDVMLMVGLNETRHPLSIANIVHLRAHVLRRKVVHV